MNDAKRTSPANRRRGEPAGPRVARRAGAQSAAAALPGNVAGFGPPPVGLGRRLRLESAD